MLQEPPGAGIRRRHRQAALEQSRCPGGESPEDRGVGADRGRDARRRSMPARQPRRARRGSKRSFSCWQTR